ncbi:hypothetical protein Tco_0820308 [Tanacetum coccineum]|uniref:Uncharacterized protein n=1 Tax=Tanacetum coccineum TaxID=301880 RepID=A0ABQ5ADR8_9ASTR
MSDNTTRAQCKHCFYFLAAGSNSTLKNHIVQKYCEALKSVSEAGQSSMAQDRSLFVYNPDVVREQFAGLVIQEALPFNHFDNTRMTRVFQNHFQPKTRLLVFVLSLDEDVVVYASQKAFESLPNVSKSISELTALKGRPSFSNRLNSRLQETRCGSGTTPSAGPVTGGGVASIISRLVHMDDWIEIGVRSSVSWIESGMVGASFGPYSWTLLAGINDHEPMSLLWLTLRVKAYVVFESEDSAQASLAHNMAVGDVGTYLVTPPMPAIGGREDVGELHSLGSTT